MRSPLLWVGVVLYLGIGALFAGSQVWVGGDRLVLGLALALPWVVAGLALVLVPRIGAWLAVGVGAVSMVAAVWYLGESGAGRGREIALLLFASPEGYWSWAGVGLIVMGLTLLFAIALAVAILLARRAARATRRGGQSVTDELRI